MAKRTLNGMNRSAPLSPKRKRAYLIVTLATPIVVLVLLEMGLREFCYGPDISLFTTEEFGGKTLHIMNPDVKHRYFNNVEFSPNTSPDYFLVPKPKGMYRIFCLGGSTTIGFPFGPIGSFSTFLRDRLKAIFPNNQIEVINLGMTATNSYTVADIAHDLVDYEPDLIIDYDGHNEFYGALGIASNESAGKFHFLTKLSLRLIHLRTFVLMRSVIRSIAQLGSTGNQAAQSGTLMERLSKGQYIPFGSPEYQQALANFKANLDDLKQVCESHGIPLIVSPQISNLRDQPPFVSQFSPGLSTTVQDSFNIEFRRGIYYWNVGEIDSALSEFNLVKFLDSGRADIHFWNAQCLDSLGRIADARKEYTLARDLDQLRFRASDDFNAAIKAVTSDPGIFFAPLEDTLTARSKDRIIGNDFILEHLHPRLEGNFLFAKVFAQVMREQGLLASPAQWKECDTLSDKGLWNRRPLTTLDELAAEVRVARLTSEWPFTRPTIIKDSLMLRGTIGSIVILLTDGKTTWERAHVAAAEFYAKNGNMTEAETEYRALINQLHYNTSAYLALGQLFGLEKKYESATKVLQSSLGIEISYEAYDMLGRIQLEDNHPSDAIPYFQKAFAFNATSDQHTSAGFLLALSKARSGRIEEAKTLLREVLSLNPTLRDAQSLLNSLTSPRSK